MSWNPLQWLGIIDKGVDIIDKAVVDKDKQIELQEIFRQLKEQTYQLELNTKTVPWVDALHKMGRQILSLLSLVVPAVLLYTNPDINPAALAAALTPGGIYNFVKGKGQ